MQEPPPPSSQNSQAQPDSQSGRPSMTPQSKISASSKPSLKAKINRSRDRIQQKHAEVADDIHEKFQQYAFLNLPNERKAELSMKLRSETQGDLLYWIEIGLSAAIATLGLLQNSVAVIIGAMLIAPLLRPIQGIAFSMTTGQAKYFRAAIWLLVKSVVLSVLMGFVIATLTPFQFETAEILARTSPNLLDLMIAIASAMIALLSLVYTRLSESVAGVAMAASLMPPLAVVGIELSLGQFGAAWGSFFLFVTNLVAIIFVGVVMFFLYGFLPHQQNTQWKALKKAVILVLVMLLISIPLLGSLKTVADRSRIQEQSYFYIQGAVEDVIAGAYLSELEITSYSRDSVSLFGVLAIPQDETFLADFYDQLHRALEVLLDREVELNFQIIPLVSVVSSEEVERSEVEDNLRGYFSAYVENMADNVEIVDFEVVPLDDEDFRFGVKPILALATGQEFPQSAQAIVEQAMRDQFPEYSLQFSWIVLTEYSLGQLSQRDSAEEAFYQQKKLQWEFFVESELPDTVSVENFKLSWNLKDIRSGDSFSADQVEQFFVSFDLWLTSADSQDLDEIQEQILDYLEENIGSPLELDMRVVIYGLYEFELDGGVER